MERRWALRQIPNCGQRRHRGLPRVLPGQVWHCWSACWPSRCLWDRIYKPRSRRLGNTECPWLRGERRLTAIRSQDVSHVIYITALKPIVSFTFSCVQKRANSELPLPRASKKAKTAELEDPTKVKQSSGSRDRRRTKLTDTDRKSEEYQSVRSVNVTNLNISSSGWMGKNYNATAEGRRIIAAWMDYTILSDLTKFHQIPYNEWVSLSSGYIWKYMN